MNKDNAKDYLPLVQALADGKVIQALCADGTWKDQDHINTDCPSKWYRIKPKSREVWVNHYGDSAPGAMAWSSLQIAKGQAGSGATQVRYREVIE